MIKDISLPNHLRSNPNFYQQISSLHEPFRIGDCGFKEVYPHSDIFEGTLLTKDSCERLIKLTHFDDYQNHWRRAETIDPSLVNYRESDIFWIDDRVKTIRKSFELFVNLKVLHLFDQFWQSRSLRLTTANIIRYQENEFYQRHVDASLGEFAKNRLVSLVIFLNDVPLGGELYFNRQQITFKPRAGKCVVFPSIFTHPHESKPVLEGNKYVLVSWFA